MSKRHISNLKIIPVNKTVVFYSPIEGDDVLVRTGTIAGGSCFFHALLHAYSTDYASMDLKERMKFVRRLKASLVGRVDKESWEEIGGGLLAMEPFKDHVVDIITNFYQFLSTSNKIKGRSTRRVIKNLAKKSVSDLHVYKILMDIFPLDGCLDKHIIPTASKKSSIKGYTKVLIAESLAHIEATKILDSIDTKKATFIKDALTSFLTIVVNEARDSAFKEYISGLETIGLEIDSCVMDFITQRLDRDIYFLDGNTRLPLNTHESNKGRKSIMVLSLDNGKHYEVVGRLLPGNRIQREFDPTDHLIEKNTLWSKNSHEAVIQYPELKPYLPSTDSPRRRSKTHDEESNDEESNDEESNDEESNDEESDNEESDSYYDNSDADSHSSSDGSIYD